MDKRTGTNGSTSAREDENIALHTAEASPSREFDKDSIAIRTGLYQIEEGSGRKLAVLICSKQQRTLPNRPFFFRAEILYFDCLLKNRSEVVNSNPPQRSLRWQPSTWLCKRCAVGLKRRERPARQPPRSLARCVRVSGFLLPDYRMLS